MTTTTSTPTRDELLQRARDMVPVLTERARAAEELRRVPDETVSELHASGLFRILQPRYWGGYEFDFGLLTEVGLELGRGCASTGWVYCNLASHHWMMGMMNETAQHAVWDDDPEALVCSSFAFPAGRATKVDGGYRIRGNWPFASGIDCSSWIMLGALVENYPDQPNKPLAFLVPQKDYQVIDNWYVTGLRATGSKNIKVDDLFVADALTFDPADLRGGPTPGSTLNDGSLFRTPLLATFGFVLSGVAVGVGKGALENYIDVTSSRMTTYTGAKAAEFSALHLKVGEASALLQAAELLLKNGLADLNRYTDADQVPDVLSKLSYRRDGTYAIKLATQAVDLIYGASGGRALFEDNPIQRAFRDIHAAAAHINNNWELAATSYGRVALGLPPDNPMI